MSQEQLKEKWMDYMNGSITLQEWESFKSHATPAQLAELEGLEKIWLAMDELPAAPEPEPTMDERFYATLSEFRKEATTPKGTVNWAGILEVLSWRRLALGMLIFAVGGGFGYVLSPSGEYKQEISSLSSEMKDMKEMMMLTLLEKPAVQDRLRAVSLSSELPEADSRVIEALVQTLNTDENVNVRMVTVEALARFGRYPEVRQALVSSISKQSSPMVQIALAEAMVALNEKGAVEALKGLLEKDDLNDIVRQKVQQSIEVLT
ncbi:MAG: HEAT repeat domain-containing protein [Imperialibacter sp.]